MSRTIRLVLAAAALTAFVPAASASADPDPLCRMHWEKPTVWYDENGLPQHVVVERPYWVC